MSGFYSMDTDMIRHGDGDTENLKNIGYGHGWDASNKKIFFRYNLILSIKKRKKGGLNINILLCGVIYK